MEKIIITLAVSVIGGMMGIKFKVPGGAIIGSMVAVAIYNIVTSGAFMPDNLKNAAQIMVGGMIGLNFTWETVENLKKMALPIMLFIICLTVISLFLGFIISKITGIDLVTALFSSAPGGLADMVLISESYGADTSIVASMHLIRLVTIITLIPIIIRSLAKLIK